MNPKTKLSNLPNRELKNPESYVGNYVEPSNQEDIGDIIHKDMMEAIKIIWESATLPPKLIPNPILDEITRRLREQRLKDTSN